MLVFVGHSSLFCTFNGHFDDASLLFFYLREYLWFVVFSVERSRKLTLQKWYSTSKVFFVLSLWHDVRLVLMYLYKYLVLRTIWRGAHVIYNWHKTYLQRTSLSGLLQYSTGGRSRLLFCDKLCIKQESVSSTSTSNRARVTGHEYY
jgi:hypothetical protein